MTPEQFREMRVKLVNTLQKPWHEIDAILNEYAPPWPAVEDKGLALSANMRRRAQGEPLTVACGCGLYRFSAYLNQISVGQTVHRKDLPCYVAEAS